MSDGTQIVDKLGTRDNPHRVAPPTWPAEGSMPYADWCICSRCERVFQSTILFDCYADKAGDPLICEVCIMQRAFKPSMHRYTLKSTGGSSDRYGDCEVCHQCCSEVFEQMEERAYSLATDEIVIGQPTIGWTRADCPTVFGHEACLISIRREVKI